MSLSTETLRRTRVLRDTASTPAPLLADLALLSGAARSVLDQRVVEESRAAGYELGRAEGLEAGRQDALAQAAHAEAAFFEARTAALAALARAAADLDAREARTLADVEEAVVAGAFELATALVGRELELAAAPGRDALHRALLLTTGRQAVLARLHPDDVASLGDVTDLAAGRDITVVADPTVERAGCVLEVGQGRIDAQLSVALARVKEVLAP